MGYLWSVYSSLGTLPITFCYKKEIRTATRDLEQSAREVLAVLQAVHQTPNLEGEFAEFSSSRLLSHKCVILCFIFFFWFKRGHWGSLNTATP